MSDIVNVSKQKDVAIQLQSVWKTLGSPTFLSGLRDVSAMEARELRCAFLRVIGFLDDSVSNPYLGSIFDRSGKDPLNEMLSNIASAYGVTESIAGTTGTTGLNVPAVMALASQDEWIAVGRDSHVSIVGGLYLSGAKPVYLMPPFNEESGVMLPPSTSEMSKLLDENPTVQGIVLTMPTYHGLMGDVASIVDECHRRDIVVMVDEAHAPHFHFLRGIGFPVPAEDVGCDVVTQSTHKVLGALSQASLVHFNHPGLIQRYAEFMSTGFQSTSFSYPILLSIENAIEQMVTCGKYMWKGALVLRQG